MEHTCSIHQLILAYDTDRKGWYCQWPKCTTFVSQQAQSISYAGLPTVQEVWQKITYDVKFAGTQVAITANLPPGFTMPSFTKIYFLKDAADYNMTQEEYIQAMKARLLNDLILRLQAQR